MSNSSTTISEADLHAYIDGVLEPEKLDAVEQYLAENSDEAARLMAYNRLGESLHQAYNPILSQPIPTNFSAKHFNHFVLIRRAAASVAMIAIGAMLGWSLNDSAPVGQGSYLSQGLVRPAAVAHAVFTPEVRHPVEVSAEQEAHLSNWLSKRLGAKLKPPFLGDVGFDLVGGRLLPSNDGPAAQFMYQDNTGKRMTLYVRQLTRGGKTSAFRYSVENGMGVFYWIDGKLGYALIGDLPRAELLNVAEKTYQRLNF